MAIHILYEPINQSYQANAELLASEIGATAASLDTEASAIEGLDTIILMGHGVPKYFCDKTASAMKAIIKSWKDMNSTLKTIEIITCNARHYVKYAVDQAYADSLKAEVGGFFGGLKLKIKALPEGVSGSENSWSILLVHRPTKSWCYVTAAGRTDDNLLAAANLIRMDKAADGTRIAFDGDIAEKADKVVRKNPDPERGWTMNYGYFEGLRAHLCEV